MAEIGGVNPRTRRLIVTGSLMAMLVMVVLGAVLQIG